MYLHSDWTLKGWVDNVRPYDILEIKVDIGIK